MQASKIIHIAGQWRPHRNLHASFATVAYVSFSIRRITPLIVTDIIHAMEEPKNVGSQYHDAMLARCARGDHDPVRKYGTCGIISAILLFPCGLICLFTDSKKRCARCGEPIP
ncbi:hypothetical protein NM688_g8438 [Phlebia brevispora]|uniref:Uncharacterized protein n=1 Tax=Phlebia brevispora TaxID=194682 RepID=A0ACC1RTU0_9APHY|nr:hypothetical protein NM688_g8438 [Phlebia brevispora]